MCTRRRYTHGEGVFEEGREWHTVTKLCAELGENSEFTGRLSRSMAGIEATTGLSTAETCALILHCLLQPCSASQRPPKKALDILCSQLPKIFQRGLLQQLELTVDTYVGGITPSEREREAKRSLFNAFADFLRRAMHNRVAISVAGSTAYEVDARGSDLDVVLLTNWGAPPYILSAIVRYLHMTQDVQKNTNTAWPLKYKHTSAFTLRAVVTGV